MQTFLRKGEQSAALEGERPPEAGPNPVCLHKAAFASQYYSQTPVSSFPYNLLHFRVYFLLFYANVHRKLLTLAQNM
jgi:hypothetical protein